MKKLIILAGLAMVLACSPCKQISKHPEKFNCFPADTVLIEKNTIIRDSILFTKIDSIGYDILFECDSNNNVLMRELNEQKSKGVVTNVVFKDNRLILTAQTDSIKSLLRIIENLEKKETSKVNPINAELKAENERLKSEKLNLVQKAKTKNKVIFTLIIIIVLGLLALKLIR